MSMSAGSCYGNAKSPNQGVSGSAHCTRLSSNPRVAQTSVTRQPLGATQRIVESDQNIAIILTEESAYLE